MATKRPKLSPAAAASLPPAGVPLTPIFAADCVLSYIRNRLLVPSLPCRAILDAYPDEASRLRDVFAGVAERHENATILVVGRRYL
jgi:hypothetical protein